MGMKSLFFNGIDYLLNIRLPEKVISKPRNIQIEVTNRCNLRCYMCYINNLKRDQKGELSFDNFKKIIRNFNYYHTVKLSGIGEPFLNKSLLKMVDYEKRRGNQVMIYSNALLINETMANKLIGVKLDTLFVSFDASTKKTYDVVRRGGNFELLMKNLRYIQTLKKKLNVSKPEIMFNTTLMQTNKGEMFGILDIMEELGIKKINIQEVQVGKEGQTVPESESLSLEYNSFLNKMREVGFKKGIEVIIPVVKKRAARENCVSPWLQTYITYEGYVTPCCRNISSKHYVCGNILKAPFGKIWNNGKYSSFRMNLRNNKLHHVCRDCTAL
jgi:radical SAM protein with 4Fe4S-binding SPASM domain